MMFYYINKQVSSCINIVLYHVDSFSPNSFFRSVSLEKIREKQHILQQAYYCVNALSSPPLVMALLSFVAASSLVLFPRIFPCAQGLSCMMKLITLHVYIYIYVQICCKSPTKPHLYKCFACRSSYCCDSSLFRGVHILCNAHSLPFLFLQLIFYSMLF